MHPDDLDITADGAHGYLARLGDREVHVSVAPHTLGDLALTSVEEPLVVRRTVEALPAGAVAALPDAVELSELGSQVDGWPDIVLARLTS